MPDAVVFGEKQSHGRVWYSVKEGVISMNREEVQHVFRNPPVLETGRLLLRRMLKTDYKDMYAYASRPEVTQYLLWNPHESESYTRQYLQYIQSRYRAGEFYDWAIVLKEQNRMVGTCGFTRFMTDANSAEIGYVLHPDCWGQGIAVEAARAVLRFGFVDLHLHRIEAHYMEANLRSRRVMEKIGMQFEGVLRESLHVKGMYVSVGICAILRDEYFASVRMPGR